MQTAINIYIVIVYVFAGLINIIPGIGALSNERLESLYGLSISSPELSLLLRHRALLFVIVGALLLLAAWRPDLRLIAGLGGLFSMLSFVAIAKTIGIHEGPLQRVVWVDVIASAALVPALGLSLWMSD